MKKTSFLTLLIAALLINSTAVAQSKIKDGTVSNSSNLPNADALVEFESNNKGVLLPRVPLMAINNASPLTAHVKGMLVYNTDTAGTAPYNVTPGFYYNTGIGWARIMDQQSYKPVILAGGDGADAITTTTTINATKTTAPQQQTIATRQFTLDRESLVTLSYHIGGSQILQSNGTSAITDGRTKLYGVSLSFSQLPASSSLTADQDFVKNYNGFSNSSNGGYVSGIFYVSGAPQLKLGPGTYTLNIAGYVFVSTTDDQGISVKFGGTVIDRIDITAIPLQ